MSAKRKAPAESQEVRKARAGTKKARDGREADAESSAPRLEPAVVKEFLKNLQREGPSKHHLGPEK